MDQSNLGFPDGGLTELERAQKPLFQIYSVGHYSLLSGNGPADFKPPFPSEELMVADAFGMRFLWQVCIQNQ